MITGNLIGELKVDGKVNDKLVVNANETKTFEVELINKNNRQARFNFYYKGDLPNNVKAGYVEGDGYNSMVKETGVNLTANGSLGYFLKYQIKVKNNTSGSITIPLGYEVGLDYNDLSLPSNCHLFEKMKVDAKPALEVLLSDYTNDESVQDYNVNYVKTDTTAKENKMYVFNHASNKGTQQSNWSSDELKDYRYIGADPNNYVTFNNEVAGWRIIGIETVDNGSGKGEKRIKLIRKDLLPAGENNYISWDNKSSEIGTSETDYGSNDWTDSRLMMVLNPGYDNNEYASGGKGSLYWNRQSGSCPYDIDNRTIDCDFSKIGLTKEAKIMIGNTKWYLGGEDGADKTVNSYYTFERSEKIYKHNSIRRKTYWFGRIGLLYPSDYGYATSGGSTTNRNDCFTMTLYNWNKDAVSDCRNNNFLYNDSMGQWTITSFSNSPHRVFRINNTGWVGAANANVPIGVRPVVYLKASTLYISGNGTKENPFVFEYDSSIDNEEPVCKFTGYPDNFAGSLSDGIIQVECTDNSGSLASDLTSDSIVGVNPEGDFTLDVVLTNTETIESGKRYTFHVNVKPFDFDGCVKLANFWKLKAYSVKDKDGNGNLEIMQVINYSTNEPCAPLVD